MIVDLDRADIWKTDPDLLLDGGFYLVHFEKLPDTRERSIIAGSGVDFVEYLAGNIWLLFLKPETILVLEDVADVDALSLYEPWQKVSPYLSAVDGKMKVNIHLMPTRAGIEPQETLEKMEQMGLVPLNDMLSLGSLVIAEIDAHLLPHIAALEGVLWIDEHHDPNPLMDNIRSNDYMGAVTPQSHGFTGEGILGEVQDDGIDFTHQDLENMIWTDGYVYTSSHGTCTSGIVFGTGKGDEKALGMLPNGTGAFADWYTGRLTAISNLWEGEFREGDAGMHGLFQTNSWHSGSADGYYNTYSNQDDTGAYNYPHLLQLWALGNYGSTEGRITTDSTAKNVIGVGAIFHMDTADLSDDEFRLDGSCPSRGPAADGRQKPDLIGPYDWIYTVDRPGPYGYSYDDYFEDFGGTSGATPNVAGCSGILYQMYISDFFDNNPENDIPLSSTIKALLIADAYQYPLDPDRMITRNVQGWGTPDLEYTYELGSKYHFIVDGGVDLDSGQSWEDKIYVDSENPLKISLVWIDPPAPASTGASRALLNNLDLKVTSPRGEIYWGNNGLWDSLWSSAGSDPNHWAISSDEYRDDLNNVENVFIEDPTEGVWSVNVLAREGDIAKGPQNFSVVASGAISGEYIFIENPLNTSFVNGTTVISGNAASQTFADVFIDEFEDGLNASWSRGDLDPANGLDYWDVTDYRGLDGSQSVWAAEVGSTTDAYPVWDDFDDSWPDGWSVRDDDSYSGLSYWGRSKIRSNSGDYSVWCSQQMDSYSYYTLYYEGFGYIYSNSSLPYGWADASYGPVSNPWQLDNYDYVYVTSWNHYNITERLYMTIPFSAQSYSNLKLNIDMEFFTYNGDEYARVLYATGSSYPHFYELENWTSYKYGYVTLDLSEADGESEIYLAFEYHGTYDESWLIDDIQVTGRRQVYDTYMDAWMVGGPYDLRTASAAYLNFSAWVETEPGDDVFYWMASPDGEYYSGDSVSGYLGYMGWQEYSLDLSNYDGLGGSLLGDDSVWIAFRFNSDSYTNAEGVYIDDVLLMTTNQNNENSHCYDDSMNAYLERPVALDLAGLGRAYLNYYYWIDSEEDMDYLISRYHDSTGWHFIEDMSGQSDWYSSTVEIPRTTDRIGFSFQSNGSIHNFEGAYLDRVSIIGELSLSRIEIRIDDGPWSPASGTTNWSFAWNTAGYSEGAHNITARGYFGDFYYEHTITVYVDNIDPVTDITADGTFGDNDWYNSQVACTMDSSDANGILRTSYRINGGAWHIYNGTFTVADEGAHTLEYFSIDNAGNIEETRLLYLPMDLNPPTSKVIASGTIDENRCFVTPVSISLSVNAGPSGTWASYYRVDDSQWKGYFQPFTIDEDGVHFVEFFSIDRAGNAEEIKLHAVLVDVSPPSSTCTLSGTEGSDGWYQSAVEVLLEAEDEGAGLESIMFCLDSDDWDCFDLAFDVLDEGMHTISFYAVDNTGKAEAEHDTEINIDMTPPESLASISGKLHSNGWYSSDVAITISGTDSLSGFSKAYYRTDGGNWTEYDGSIVISGDGDRSVEFFAVDNAGNNESVHSMSFKCDCTAPEITSLYPLDESRSTSSEAVISWSAEDQLSGVDHYEIMVDASPGYGEWIDLGNSMSYSLEGLSDGWHMVLIKAVDAAGNAEIQRIDFDVDTAAFSMNGPYNGVPLILTVIAVLALAVVALTVIYIRRKIMH